jgi:hypothetical protein
MIEYESGSAIERPAVRVPNTGEAISSRRRLAASPSMARCPASHPAAIRHARSAPARPHKTGAVR